ncbi:hypothetical protein [Ktedonobacter robiniae]|uniref:HhH-GPD domain-containing protein n=1 Tax=Ktedonobacter robiniae TaxID=2778365 RepID=A0ABQ3URM3_9CHLR|nr:hypothetical protein [Ktedonobacter robiniae]GHO55015.1 hypothetical protein KSB_34900 [Ktedonobacter robiniae]
MTQPNKRERTLADYGYPTQDIARLKEKAHLVTQRLTELYGPSDWSKKDPMSMLVNIILSHRTKDAQTAAAYDNLLKRFGSWEAVRDAPTSEVQETIANVNWPEVKVGRSLPKGWPQVLQRTKIFCTPRAPMLRFKKMLPSQVIIRAFLMREKIAGNVSIETIVPLLRRRNVS